MHLLPDPERIDPDRINIPKHHRRSNKNDPKTKHKNKHKQKTKQKNYENYLKYLPILSEGVVDFNYDNDPFSAYFDECTLRVQFYGDDGVGSGPTMEFFTLSTDGLDSDLQLWIDNDTHISKQFNTDKNGNTHITIPMI